MAFLAAALLLSVSAAAGPNRSLPMPGALPGATLSFGAPVLPPTGLPLSPATPDLIRLIVEPIPDARGWAFIKEEDRAAITLALEEAKGQARVINSDGPSAIFEGQSFVEVTKAAAPKLTQDLETLGLRVSRLDEVLENARSTQKALDLGSDDLAAAAAGRLMDGSRHPRDRSEELGALLTAVETQPTSHLSPATRRAAAHAVYSGLVNAINAHNAITGDVRMAARKRWIDAHGGQVGSYQDMELSAHADLQQPAHRAQVAPIRALVSRAANAIQILNADVSTPLLVELLPHAGHALLEDLANDGKRAQAFVASYIAMIRGSVDDTARLAEEYALSTDDARKKEIRMTTHSGGISSMDQPKVDGHRTAVWAYDQKAWFYNLGDLSGSPWPLLGVSQAAAQAVKDSFVDLLVAAGPQIKRVDDALRFAELERESKSFDHMAGKFLEDPKIKDQMDELRKKHLADRQKQYDEYNTVEGNEVLDRTLRGLGWFGPYTHLVPGFDTDQYVRFAASILRDAAARTGPGMFKLVAQTALRFSEDVRKYAWPTLFGDSKDAVDALERDVKARAATEGLKLYP